MNSNLNDQLRRILSINNLTTVTFRPFPNSLYNCFSDRDSGNEYHSGIPWIRAISRGANNLRFNDLICCRNSPSLNLELHILLPFSVLLRDKTEGGLLRSGGVSFCSCGVSFRSCGVSFRSCGVSFSSCGVTFRSGGVSPPREESGVCWITDPDPSALTLYPLVKQQDLEELGVTMSSTQPHFDRNLSDNWQLAGSSWRNSDRGGVVVRSSQPGMKDSKLFLLSANNCMCSGKGCFLANR